VTLHAALPGGSATASHPKPKRADGAVRARSMGIMPPCG